MGRVPPEWGRRARAWRGGTPCGSIDGGAPPGAGERGRHDVLEHLDRRRPRLYVSGAGLGHGVESIDEFPETGDVPHFALLAPRDHVVGAIQGLEAEPGDVPLGHGASPVRAEGVVADRPVVPCPADERGTATWLFTPEDELPIARAGELPPAQDLDSLVGR